MKQSSLDANIIKVEIFTTNIVGMSHKPGARGYLDALDQGEAEFTLVPEPTNPYDQHAVKVMHEAPNGRIVDLGYVKGVDAERVCQFIADGRVVTVGKNPMSKSGSGIEICLKTKPNGDG